MLLTLSPIWLMDSSDALGTACGAIFCATFLIIIIIGLVAAQKAKAKKMQQNTIGTTTHTPPRGVVIAKVPPPAIREAMKEKKMEKNEEISTSLKAAIRRARDSLGENEPEPEFLPVKRPREKSIPDVPRPATPPQGTPSIPSPAQPVTKPPEPSSA